MTKEQLARDRMAKAVTSGKLIRAAYCELCGRLTKTEGHHRDYTKPFEIQWLCRKCHMKIDGRLDGIHRKKKHPPKLCHNCKRLSKPLRKGRCHACNEYLRRHGYERPYLVDGRYEKTATSFFASCLRCQRNLRVVGKPVRGYCRSCYRTLWGKKQLPPSSPIQCKEAQGQLRLALEEDR